jgi:hypothetical protein
MNLVTPKAGAENELLFNKLAKNVVLPPKTIFSIPKNGASKASEATKATAKVMRTCGQCYKTFYGHNLRIFPIN